MKQIALIPGDGIGKDVTKEGIKVIDTLCQISSFVYEAELFDIGSERFLKTGELLTDEDILGLKRKDAIYFGAVGSPKVKPGVLEKGILLRMRSELDQYINLRPARSYKGYSPLKSEKDFDILFIRENSEDFYMGAGGVIDGDGSVGLKLNRAQYRLALLVDMVAEPKDEMAFEVGMLSKRGIERFADYVFDAAAEIGEKRVTLVDKANVCDMYGVQRKIFAEKAAERGVSLEYMYVDAMSMALVSRPDTFGIVAVPNMFGDILTDLAAELQGGLGLSASGNINPNGVCMFEPIHGSAPDIAGKGIANPIAVIMAAKMMLDNLGYHDEANIIDTAVNVCMDNGIVTPDLGGRYTTQQVGDAVCKEILSDRR